MAGAGDVKAITAFVATTHPHPLVMRSIKGHTCDQCDHVIREEDKAYSCPPCDYDICSKCMLSVSETTTTKAKDKATTNKSHDDEFSVVSREDVKSGKSVPFVTPEPKKTAKPKRAGAKMFHETNGRHLFTPLAPSADLLETTVVMTESVRRIVLERYEDLRSSGKDTVEVEKQMVEEFGPLVLQTSLSAIATTSTS